MGNLTEQTTPTKQAVWQYWEKQNEPPRMHLGASQIGHECERKLWYSFRWCAPETFIGRMLRLFNRGKREELIIAEELRGIGVNLLTLDPRTGKPPEVHAHGGHIGGSADGIAIGFPEAPKTWHVVEEKTHSAKSFAQIVLHGVMKSKPMHYAQMQLYMLWFELDRAMYYPVNKDTDEIEPERVKLDKHFALGLEAKAKRVVDAKEPGERMALAKPEWWECKICPAVSVCHLKKVPPVNCRTCIHATPELNGNARWSCARHKVDIGEALQRTGCDDHRYIPALYPHGKVTDASEEENWIEYTLSTGKVIRNGPRGMDSYESREMVDTAPAAFSDPNVAHIREQFDGHIVHMSEGVKV